MKNKYPHVFLSQSQNQLLILKILSRTKYNISPGIIGNIGFTVSCIYPEKSVWDLMCTNS